MLAMIMLTRSWESLGVTHGYDMSQDILPMIMIVSQYSSTLQSKDSVSKKCIESKFSLSFSHTLTAPCLCLCVRHYSNVKPPQTSKRLKRAEQF